MLLCWVASIFLNLLAIMLLTSFTAGGIVHGSVSRSPRSYVEGPGLIRLASVMIVENSSNTFWGQIRIQSLFQLDCGIGSFGQKTT